MSDERKIYSLTQLNSSIERFILHHFGSKSFWVTAEISKINEKGGHRYIELVDSINGKETAQNRATLWRSTYETIRNDIGKELDQILKFGNRVLFQFRIEYHKIYGLKLNVLNIDVTYSYGEIEKKKKETIDRLVKEKIFDLQHTLYLPTICKRIALIGSPDTSGYQDFIHGLSKNEVFTNFVVKSFPASVQGPNAAQELIAAINEAQLYDIDIIVIIRGGGSKMDLHSFNDYNLSKAICLSPIPVLTGIGHQTDETVSDLVAIPPCIHQADITATDSVSHCLNP